MLCCTLQVITITILITFRNRNQAIRIKGDNFDYSVLHIGEVEDRLWLKLTLRSGKITRSYST